MFNTQYVVDGEVTNNLYAQEYRRIKGLGGDRANWNEMMKRFKGEDFAMHYFERLGVLSQINIAYGYDAYSKMSTYVRNNTEQIKSVRGSDQQRLAVAYSLALNVDLLDFFEGWNYIEVTEEMREVVAHLPKPDKKIEYLYGAAYDYKGNGFNENLKVKVKSKINEEERTNTLSFEIDSENRDDLLGYEILKDGKVIGYTINNNFVIKDIDLSENASYDVVPYAKDLSTGKAVNIKAFSPNLDIQQESMIVNLRSDFNPADYVKGTTYKGEDISSNIKIESNVNTAEKGKYEVKYTLMGNDVKVEKVMNVEVVSSYDYLSDEEWESVETQWGTPRRNTNIKGRVNGEIKTFDKGIGIHANGKVVYDLEGKDYDRFEALLGVDQTIGANDNSSISFKVIADGETLETTKVLKYNDNMVEINIPVKGINKLEIQVSDSGNGNTSDHGIIVNPKLSTNNVKPTIKTEDAVINVKDNFNILDGVTANDVEDGDLTSSIKVKSSDFEANRGGIYTVVYEVTDKDGNTVTKERKIYTITTAESLSDKEWKSASSGWRDVKKDLSVEDNRITLLGENGQEVEYDKGLGTHANSEIVYDLSGKNYGMFETYVGVDREMRNSNEPSVIFEVYVDGKKVFDSGVMNVNTERKHVLIPIAGASELKLVAKDGGNGNGGDHADWADAKLLYADSKDFTALEKIVEEAIGLDESLYTEESFNKLQVALEKANKVLETPNPEQEVIDSTIIELRKAMDNLEAAIDLTEEVNIPDNELKRAIKDQLNLSSDVITRGDMNKLTNLSAVGYGIENLEGLQYAVNIEELNLDCNEIKDISKIKDLKKLNNVSIKEQYIVIRSPEEVEGKYVINESFVGKDGERLSPKEINIRRNTGEQSIDISNVDVESSLNNGNLELDTKLFKEGFSGIAAVYEDLDGKYVATLSTIVSR
ncbi:NPCBM/NEW2 domain-containing protein [Clostridium perfringens]|uniref:NPCBM/NEW2 domain-containing protein n=1 Tax=Clostridium perfringens TaxID=1502 RepID=UPI0031405378